MSLVLFFAPWLAYNYCNTPVWLSLLNLKRTTNYAARLVTRLPESYHISLHRASRAFFLWLPIDPRIQYKLSSLCYNYLNSTAPGYLTELKTLATFFLCLCAHTLVWYEFLLLLLFFLLIIHRLSQRETDKQRQTDRQRQRERQTQKEILPELPEPRSISAEQNQATAVAIMEDDNSKHVWK